MSEAIAKAVHRLQQEEESERGQSISCTASSTSFAKAEAAALQLGYQVTTANRDLALNAHEHPLQPVYIWEHSEDSAHEKPKILARLTEELDLSSKSLQATAVFAKPHGVVQRGRVRLSPRTDVVIHHAIASFRPGCSQLHRYIQLWQLKTTESLQDKRSAAEGQALAQFIAINILEDQQGLGVPVVLSDLSEASVFQKGSEPKDIVHVKFQNLEEAYAHIRWLLDTMKANRPILHLDTSRAPPAEGMWTIMQQEDKKRKEKKMKQQAHRASESTNCHKRLRSTEDGDSMLRKEHVFRQQLPLLAANDERVAEVMDAFSQDPQRLPSIWDFVPMVNDG